MAAYVGKNGFITLGTTADSTGSVTLIDSWTLNSGVGTADITGYGDSARAFAQTIREWSASVTGTMDRSDTGQDTLMDVFDTTGGTTGLILRLYSGTTSYWQGTVFPTGLTINSAVDDKIGFSADLQGSSNLEYSG